MSDKQLDELDWLAKLESRNKLLETVLEYAEIYLQTADNAGVGDQVNKGYLVTAIRAARSENEGK